MKTSRLKPHRQYLFVLHNKLEEAIRKCGPKKKVQAMTKNIDGLHIVLVLSLSA